MTSTNCFRMKSRRPMGSSLECRPAALGTAPADRRAVPARGNRLDVVREHLAKPLVIAAAAGEPRAAPEDQDVIAVKPWLQLADGVDVHDDRPMHTEKSSPIELPLHGAECLANEVHRGTDVETDIVVRG